MTPEHVACWVSDHPLSPVHVDCVTAVMLKILDGKCKMASEEKIVMALLYEAVRREPGEQLGAEFHRLIDARRGCLDDAMREHIYETRVLAEAMISRPVMKAFKAMLRETGLLGLGQ